MKFPRIPFALLLVAGLVWPVAAASSTAAKPKAAKAAKGAAKAKSGPKKALNAAQKQDSIRLAGLTSRLDSLKAVDSLHRLDSIRVADSLKVVESRIRVDSMRRADSLGRIDSLERATRTWYPGRIRDFTNAPESAKLILEKLRIQILRTGGISLADHNQRDSSSGFEGSWKAATASGAGRFLHTSLQRTADSGWKLSAWLFELPSGRKLDSVSATVAANANRKFDELALQTAQLLHPTPAQAKCRTDSVAQASMLWALEIPVNHTTDTALTRSLRAALSRELVSTGRARTLLLSDSVYCPKRRCLDSLSAAHGAARTLQSDIFRLPDSTWRVKLIVSASATGGLVDSILMTGKRLEEIYAKFAATVLPPPASCRSFCSRPTPQALKQVWSIGRIASDSTAQAPATELSASLSSAFAASPRHQYLALGTRDAAGDVLVYATTSQGITRLVSGRLEGSDSMWTLSVSIRNPQKDSLIDSVVLSRGGWRPRVFAWFARKLLETAHPRLAGCESPCSEDSTIVANQIWAFPPTTDMTGETALAKLLNDNLVGNMVSRRLGKVAAFPEPLPCSTMHCIDSIAASRGARNAIWTTLSRGYDSCWRMTAKLVETTTDLVVDSISHSDTGSAMVATAQLPDRVIASLVPGAKRCDSCVSQDTLEAGLALIEPQWGDVVDTLQNLFLDSLSIVLAREGHYQILPWATTDSVYKRFRQNGCDSACHAALRCNTGASFMVTSSVVRNGSGWHVEAKLIDLRTGAETARMSTHEPRNDVQRLREISPWAARKLIGTDANAKAPSSRRFLDLPWGKLAALAIPFTLGLSSVISRW
jgi:hypothetical protein